MESLNSSAGVDTLLVARAVMFRPVASNLEIQYFVWSIDGVPLPSSAPDGVHELRAGGTIAWSLAGNQLELRTLLGQDLSVLVCVQNAGPLVLRACANVRLPGTTQRFDPILSTRRLVFEASRPALAAAELAERLSQAREYASGVGQSIEVRPAFDSSLESPEIVRGLRL